MNTPRVSFTNRVAEYGGYVRLRGCFFAWARRLAWLVCVLGLALGQLASAAPVGLPDTSNPSGLQIVTLRPEADQDGLLKEHGIQARHHYRYALNGFAAPLTPAAIRNLKRDKRVLAVEPDGRVYLCGQTNGAGIIRMGLPNFLPQYFNGGDHRVDVDVAVLDSGIQTNHPDLNVYQVVGLTGYDGNDWFGHGTWVAGIIGALDNGFGVVGVAPGVRLWSVQVVAPGGFSGVAFGFLSGLDYIAAHADQIEVVNCCVGVDSSDYVAVHTAVSNVVSLGVVFVAAAGNDSNDIAGGDLVYGTSDDYLPAALPEVMAVSAMDPNTNSSTFDTIATFSNFSLTPKPPIPLPGGGTLQVDSPGAGIDVAAPGVNITSTYLNSGYITASGTSAAAPHAAGLVAQYIAANGRAHSLQDVIKIRQAIINASQPQWAWHPGSTAYSGNNTQDPDGNQEPLAYPSARWLPPVIASAQTVSGTFQVSFWTSLGYNYTLQYSDSPIWTYQWTSLTTTNGTGGMAILTDPAPASTRFYRLARTAPVMIGSTNFTWTSGGSATWFAQSSITNNGSSAFQSGNISPGQNSMLDITLTGPGVLSFWWRHHCVNIGDDSIAYYLDGVDQEQYVIFGPDAWVPVSFPIGPGSHTIRWVYSTSVSTAGPAYVGDITLTNPNLWTEP